VSTIGTGQPTSRITALNEKIYHQSNLLGDWKGNLKQNNQAVELKVVSINGDTAQVEYTHNGQTERGTGTADGRTIKYGNVTIATRNGQQAAFEFSFGPAVQNGILNKVASPAAAASTNKLQGNWTGASDEHSASFQVVAIDGRNAQVKYNIDGLGAQGIGDVTPSAVFLGKVQFSSKDGLNGNVVFKSGVKTISLPVKKFVPKTA
jgi:hypothetical protein